MREVKVGDELVIRGLDESYNIGGVRSIKSIGEALREGTKGDRVLVVKVLRAGRLDLAIYDEKTTVEGGEE